MTPGELESFVPRRLTQTLSAAGSRPTRVSAPGALLLADLSGFSTLASTLASRHGSEGAVLLSKTLDALFGALLPIVREAGGEVAKFAGDALLAHFPAGTSERPARVAARVGIAMLDAVAALPPVEDVSLGLRVAASTGDLSALRVGGHRAQWDVALVGDAVARLSQAFGAARRGTMTVDADTAAQLGDDVAREPAAGGALRLLSVSAPDARARDAAPTSDERPAVTEWLPDVVRARAAAPLDTWLAELRTLTPLFFAFPGFDPARASADELAAVVRAVQEELSQQQGALHEVAIDEKGLFLTAAFGVPGMAVERPAEAAVRAGLAVVSRLASLGLRARAGVSTGRLFVGPVGDAWRREIALIGPSMNLAARLAFDDGEGVLVDGATYALAGDAATWAPRAPLRLKGFPEPVEVWRAVAPKRRTMRADALDVVGRADVLARIDAALEAHAAGAEVALSFEGPAGIGKSRLLSALAARARRLGAPIFEAVGDLAGVDRPWHAWQHCLDTILGVDARTEPARRAEALRAALAEVPDGPERAPALAPLLGHELPDTPRTAPLSGEERARIAAELFTELCARRAGGRGAVLVIDDAQWLDPASAVALVALRRALRPSLVALTVRTGDTAPPAAVAALQHEAGAGRVAVGELDVDGVRELVARRLGVRAVPARLAAWVAEHARGNAFFVCELASALVAQGLVEVRDGEVAGDPGGSALDAVAPSINVQAVVTRRVDALEPAAQLALKAASVVGMRFRGDDLRAAHPAGAAEVDAAMRALVGAGLCADVGDDTWTFGHRITCDVAYALMLDAHRTAMHARYAAHLESSRPDDAAALAWHWERGGDIARALRHTETAWRQADRAGAVAEAHAIARHVVELLERPGAPAHTAVEVARWWHRMGEHSAAMNRYTEVIDEVRVAVRGVGGWFPDDALGWRRVLLDAVAVQAWRRFGPSWAQGRGRDDDAWAVEALSLMHAGEAFYFTQGNALVALACFVRAANRAELAGVSGHCAHAWGIMGVALTVMRAERAGRYYLDRALRDAKAVGDPRREVDAMFHQAVAAAALARWDEAERIFAESEALIRRIGALVRLNNVWTTWALNALQSGRLRAADEVAARVLALPDGVRMGRGQHMAEVVRATVSLARGDAAAAAAKVAAPRDALRAANDRGWLAGAAVSARAAAALGRHDDALREAREALDLLRGTRAPDQRRLEAYAGPAEVFVAVGLASPGAVRDREVADALAVLRGFARSYPLGRARLAALEGADALRRGARREALRCFERSEREALDRDLRWELSRARAAMAAPGGDGDARRWMDAEGVTTPGITPWRTTA